MISLVVMMCCAELSEAANRSLPESTQAGFIQPVQTLPRVDNLPGPPVVSPEHWSPAPSMDAPPVLPPATPQAISSQGIPPEPSASLSTAPGMVFQSPAPLPRMMGPVSMGTVGRTYKIPSRPVPKDRHPRTAMVELRGAMQDDPILDGVEDFKRFRDAEGTWFFESKQPLLTTIPHVYKLKLRPMVSGEPLPSSQAVMYVRLIPGRVLEVDR